MEARHSYERRKGRGMSVPERRGGDGEKGSLIPRKKRNKFQSIIRILEGDEKQVGLRRGKNGLAGEKRKLLSGGEEKRGIFPTKNVEPG